MNIYLVKRTVKYIEEDTFDSFVIVCETEEIARNMHPGTGWTNSDIDNNRGYSSWVNEKDVPKLKVKRIGYAQSDQKAGVVCASFCAG